MIFFRCGLYDTLKLDWHEFIVVCSGGRAYKKWKAFDEGYNTNVKLVEKMIELQHLSRKPSMNKHVLDGDIFARPIINEVEICAQQQHYVTPLPNLKTSQTWATNLCKRLMFLALNWWQIRNEAYHDCASKYTYTREHAELIMEVTT